MAIKVCNQLGASAQASFGVAASAVPLGSLLIAVGRKTLPLLEEQEERQERTRNGLHGQESAIADDHKFDHLGDAMKSVLKLGTMTPKLPGDEHANKVHEAKIRDAYATQACRCCTPVCISHDKKALQTMSYNR